MPSYNMPDNCPDHIYDMCADDPLDEDYVHRSELQNTDSMVHFLEEVLGHLYGSGELDKAKLEHCLDELCHLVGVKINEGDLTVERELSEDERRTKRINGGINSYLSTYCDVMMKHGGVV